MGFIVGVLVLLKDGGGFDWNLDLVMVKGGWCVCEKNWKAGSFGRYGGSKKN